MVRINPRQFEEMLALFDSLFNAGEADPEQAEAVLKNAERLYNMIKSVKGSTERDVAVSKFCGPVRIVSVIRDLKSKTIYTGLLKLKRRKIQSRNVKIGFLCGDRDVLVVFDFTCVGPYLDGGEWIANWEGKVEVKAI